MKRTLRLDNIIINIIHLIFEMNILKTKFPPIEVHEIYVNFEHISVIRIQRLDSSSSFGSLVP